MAPGSTESLTEKSTRNLPGSKGRSGLKAINLIAICELIVYKLWKARRLTTLLAFTAYYRDSFTFFSHNIWTEVAIPEISVNTRDIFLCKVGYSNYDILSKMF
jgi:hypothetical protein